MLLVKNRCFYIHIFLPLFGVKSILKVLLIFSLTDKKTSQQLILSKYNYNLKK